MENDMSNRLRSLRGEKELTQAALAERVGITQAYYNELEQGKKRPSVDVLGKLCDALGCSADYLLGLSDIRGYRAMREDSLYNRGITPELLQTLAQRHITGRELELALDFVQTMQEEQARGAQSERLPSSPKPRR